MYKEYYVTGGFYVNGKLYPRIREESWGLDEHDALERLIVKTKEELSIPKNHALPAYCRLLPTGRHINHLRAPKPAFIEGAGNEDPNTQESISRFYIRFAFAETENELLEYGDELSAFSERNPISDAVLSELRRHYTGQLERLRQSGPPNYSLQQNRPSSLPASEHLNYYCKNALAYLKMFGYRVKDQGEYFFLTSPSCHDTTHSRSKAWNAVPLDVVIHWEQFAQNLQLPFTPSIEYLGYSADEEVCDMLAGRGVTPLITVDEIGLRHLYVFIEQKEDAAHVLRSHNVHLWEGILK